MRGDVTLVNPGRKFGSGATSDQSLWEKSHCFSKMPFKSYPDVVHYYKCVARSIC